MAAPEEHDDDLILSQEEKESFIQNAIQYGNLWKLKSYADEYGMIPSGRVSRTSSHYVHERTVDFELYCTPSEWTDGEGEPLPEPLVAQIEDLANQAQTFVSEAVVQISRAIFKNLGEEYDYQFWGEGAAENISANEYEFDENGRPEDGGGYTYDQLDDRGKQRAKEWYAEGQDSSWSEYVLSDWNSRLEEAGFTDPEIAYSGFGNQGDGASFTSGFDFDTFIQYISSGQAGDIGL